jgi:RimJ/RimL family protein N-acetyltransferase
VRPARGAGGNVGQAVPCPGLVAIRPLCPGDASRFLEWAADPEVRRHFLGENAPAGGLDWVPGSPGPAGIGTSRPASHVVRAIVERGPAGERLLGWVELRDLNWRRRTGELRICLGDPATWGRGCGTAALRLFLDQAFGTWNLASIHLRVATWNTRAVRLYERCGFRREARLLAGRHEADGIEDLWLMTAHGAAWRMRAEAAAT